VQRCLALFILYVRVSPKGKKAFYTLELTIARYVLEGKNNLRAIYCEVKGGATELVLLVHIEAELSLSKVHQGKSSSVYLGSLMEEVDSTSGQEFSVCLQVIKNKVNQLLVP